MRRAVYEADGVRFDINVRALERHISIISEDGSESWLRERSRANPNRAGLRAKWPGDTPPGVPWTAA
jgi:hypothetical protein